MTVEVETSDASMASPTSSSGTGPESLRLSEIESAHLCPAGRMKMEELFRQWLNVDGTKEMIQNMVADLRQGKELNLDALLATVSTVGSGADSPSRSPKRPPNYQFGMLSPGSAGSPSARRRHQHLVSLFGDELHNAAAAVAAVAVETEAPKTEETEAAASSDDVDMTAGDTLTVVVRIFYSVDRDSSGRITLRKLRRSNLISAFNTVDEEEDINKVNSYFSYEHFYVLYCKFWELDTDHDFLLSPDDLVRYGGHALTRIIVDRIFERGRRPFARVQTLTSEEKKKMSYEDFIYFMLSEEDKANPVSIRYWFELIDTNEDGVLRADEMRVFYRHQIHRMECLGHEVVPFEDILCQMSDLLHPEKEGEFYHKDFIRPDKIRVSGVFFNVLFNLSKFIEFEQRDPFLLRQQLAEPELTDWDRYARAEYARLAMEEESRDEDTAMDIDTMDGWYVSDEQEEEAPEGGPTRTVQPAKAERSKLPFNRGRSTFISPLEDHTARLRSCSPEDQSK
ncbi:hypothetical protein AM588_10003170 [Phytophthora nicotianae]|uniref:EF-hand domain-containing protein n=1 Tax=Phytophthora nicotianae TaxID=4792 RepID=A0A0W8CVZ8_PHYNI|nr:hypothetical protein AM588_10003170 [Phytophthora nicotianae]